MRSGWHDSTTTRKYLCHIYQLIFISLNIIRFLRIVFERHQYQHIHWLERDTVFCPSSNMSFLSRFQPFTRKPYPYEPTLHQSTNYGHLPYGNRFFRHEYVDKFVVPKVIFYAFFLNSVRETISFAEILVNTK